MARSVVAVRPLRSLRSLCRGRPGRRPAGRQRGAGGSSPAPEVDLSDDPYRQSSLDPPTWRGRTHAVMVVPSIVAGVLVTLATPGAGARAVVALYAYSVVQMFAVSAYFHLRRWSDAAWLRLRRLDHLAIYGLIAGSYGAIMGLGTDGWTQTWLVGVAVGVIAAGMVVRRRLLHPPFGLMTSLFVVTGGVSMFGIVGLWRGLGTAGTVVVLVGCVFYGLGAAALGLRRPNPWPGRFGYHEVWHLNVIAAATCHYAVVAFVVVPSL